MKVCAFVERKGKGKLLLPAEKSDILRDRVQDKIKNLGFTCRVVDIGRAQSNYTISILLTPGENISHKKVNLIKHLKREQRKAVKAYKKSQHLSSQL